LQGDDASWREASIQPVPIPDLGHTGIRTKFSTGAGDGFTPDGTMTETFRTDIHDTVRNLPPATRRDARDMKTRDYARAIRKHRPDPCGGSLLHAHMSSLELGSTAGGDGLLLHAEMLTGGSGAGAGAGAGARGLLRQSSSLGTFRSRFSPPSSPLSARRALAGYGRGRSGGGDGPGVGDGEWQDSRATTPAGSRQALLLRELGSVKLAAVAMAGGAVAVEGGSASGGARGGGFSPTETRSAGVRPSATGKGRGGSRKGGNRGTGAKESCDEGRLQDLTMQDAGGNPGCSGGAGDGGRDFERSLDSRSGADKEGGGGGGSGMTGVWSPFRGDSRADEGAWRADRRGRGERRGGPSEAGADGGRAGADGGRLGGGYGGDVPAERLVPPAANSSLSSNSRQRSTSKTATEPAATARDRTNPSPPPSRRPSTKAKSKRRPKPQEAFHRLKTPFSSGSLLSCLLDVRFGNTRDLSPWKPPGKRWDLGVLPAGITAPVGAWDGFDESDEGADEGDGGGAAGRAYRHQQPRYQASEHRSTGSDIVAGRDFAQVRDG
ncbi:unnamed protein product, partial [Hapterophycus canaliculatus]